MTEHVSKTADRLIHFNAPVAGLKLPERFNYPFYYTPDPLVLQAAKELQSYLEAQTNWEHNFGLDPKSAASASGKMFGVLVVQTSGGDFGYLAAFSGGLNGENDTSHFVPPVHDLPEKDSFVDAGMEALRQLTKQITALESNPAYVESVRVLEENTKQSAQELAAKKHANNEAKKDRKTRRVEGTINLTPEGFDELNDDLIRESQRQKSELKALTKSWETKLHENRKEVEAYTTQIDRLKTERKKKSGELQRQIFDRYHFLNQVGESRSLVDIFRDTTPGIPPAAAGECAAPKLLQYAYQHQLRPLAMGEFWWGKPPKSELRRHGFFYPACRGKCEPILNHMLKGLEVEENPLLRNQAKDKQLEVLFDDESLVVVNKPAGLLSVPGSTIQDSVLTRIKEKYPAATGSVVVHRLDMATSGIMILTKDADAHKFIHNQFQNRTIKKRYVALLEGNVEADHGFIDLPLRVDINDRPRQMVCEEHGKPSQTKWKVIARSEQRTRVHFYPITGRSHQLRVHSAHPRGLNVPIVGDDLYGTKANRLHLHAAAIEFVHPRTKKPVKVEVQADF